MEGKKFNTYRCKCCLLGHVANDIVFKSDPTTLFVDPFQGNTLDKIMGFASERRDL